MSLINYSTSTFWTDQINTTAIPIIEPEKNNNLLTIILLVVATTAALGFGIFIKIRKDNNINIRNNTIVFYDNPEPTELTH